MTQRTADSESPAKDRARRALLAWLAAGAAGAALALFAAGRTWASVTLPGGPGLAPAAPVPLAGGDLAPVLAPLALACLAALVAVLATRGPWRRAIGVLLAAAGLAAAVASWRGVSASHAVSAALERATLHGDAARAVVAVTWAWPVLAIAAGIMLSAAGALAVARGGAWPGMSDRYDRPGPSAAAPKPGRAERSLWDALDQGLDPTDVPKDGHGDRDG
ncbi:Trp biosynthesis-associated membrane protein [Sphaerisporangium corydalis]|uniref:Trp biosynthesis-associated membrane protein n=1 Tax=Sphaerisporangium corydalis TaxID=1441875 RepID=A0ABV9EC19_9ACTN|nr:Trp biosynthesis-associated membrane protein [Sphaerisporangium corydalis]